MREQVTVVGCLHIAFGLMGAIGGTIVLILITGGGLMSGDPDAIMITGVVGPAIASVLFVFSIPAVIGGIAFSNAPPGPGISSSCWLSSPPRRAFSGRFWESTRSGCCRVPRRWRFSPELPPHAPPPNEPGRLVTWKEARHSQALPGAVISRLKEHRQKIDPRKRDLSPSILDFGPVTFVLARHFGFCFGVENAVEIAYRTLEVNPDRRIFFLSEMIHNPK